MFPKRYQSVDPLGPVFTSTDGGSRWRAARSGLPPDNGVVALAAEPSNPLIAYAGTTVSGLFKTTNGGAAWSYNSASGSGVTAVAVHPTSTSTVYAGVGSGYFRKSTDRGMSWTTQVPGPSDPIVAFALHPMVPRTVYAGFSSSGVFKSIDGGSTWMPMNGLGSLAIDELAVHPSDSDRIFAATLSPYGSGGGLYESTDGG